MGCKVESKQILAGSVNTTYLSAGTGTPLILLHGAGAGAVTWYPSFSSLSKRFWVIAPDIVGYGESEKPDAAYDRPYFANWLKDFLSALSISRAHVVGLSQGGAIALQFVLENPGAVDKLVLVDSGGLGAQPSLPSFFGMLWLNSFPSALANRFYARYILHRPENRDPCHASYSLAVIKGKGGKKAFRQGRGAAVSAISEVSLRQMSNEMLLVWGEDDQLFPIVHGERAADIIPNARIVRLKEAGHLPLMDQPEKFNQALMDFLE
jgi:4,5:9,10-diseco-3-hydroxy-5,9,17-trioxoandrosta-1(10),2-diene-4-oate hydrolase